ncbi:MAG TPA: PAS domain S-box protein [Methylomirabilota bacterium]|nr:PAS domain S-box protein [Methylomirabilota bacterium]
MRKRNGEALGRLAAIVESSNDAIIGKTLDGVITSWNRGAVRLFGYTAAEIVGRPMLTIIPPERHDEERSVLARVRAGHAVEPFDTVRLRKDGSAVDVSLTVSPVRDARGRITGASTIARDISERRRAEELAARLAAIVSSADDAIVSKTLDGVITSWNAAAERMFGYSAAEAIGQPIYLIIPPDRYREEESILARLRRAEAVEHFETVRRRKDGALVDVSITVSPLRDGRGRIIGASKIARDVSERRRLERDRALLYEEAQEANRAKDEFIAMLGHELRNPLGAISSAVRLLEPADALSDRAALARDVIARQTRHLARLVDDLLDVVRVMTGKVLLERHPLDLAEVVTRHLNSLRTTGKMQDHVVTLEATPVWVDADVVRLEQVIGNLVSNALKYTPAGGGIVVSVSLDGGEAVLSVADTGVGIAPHLVSRIFDLFVQGERRLDRAQGGLGIGLTLVRRLVELHGGSVKAESIGIGQGSRFTVRLRAVPAPRPAAAAGLEPRAVVPRRILVVEDNRDARDMLRHVLEVSGHEVHEALDGRQGLEAALRLRPDVALIDLGLPELDGYELARQIRAADPDRRMLLVAVTGYGSAEDRERSLTAGFDLHLVKPVDVETLNEVLLPRGAC